MQVQLFHAPYIDEIGLSRQRLCAVVSGADVDGNLSNEFLDSLHQWLVDCGNRPSVFAFDTVDDVTVSWL